MATTDRREMLREAMNEAAEEETETPELETPAEEEAPAAEAEPAGDVAAPPEDETAEQKAERERDDKGRFAAAEKGRKPEPAAAKPKPGAIAAPGKPVTATGPGAKPVVAKPAVEAQPAAAAHPGADLKAPQSWTPLAREEWAKVPPGARQEIHRLEGETRKVLDQNAQMRRTVAEATQFQQTLNQAFSPYEAVARAAGAPNAYAFAENVMQAAATLQMGTEQQRAATLAGLITQYGGNLDLINAALAGQAPQQAPAYQPPRQAQQQPVDVDALFDRKLQAFAQQREASQADQELETWMATSPEFARDVWQDMQDILDLSVRSGRKLTYQQAYDRACKLDERVQQVLAQRAEVAAATAQPSAAPAQRARVAAATVRPRPAGGVGGPGAGADDRRTMLSRAAARSRG
jgi:hypothetical protein